MADLSGLYDEQDAPQDRNFDLMPKGWVEAMIVDSSDKETPIEGSTEVKKRVTLVYQILDQRPEYKNRKHWHGLNLKNPSVEAQNISRGQFSSIRKATGIVAPKDSTELHNLPHMILIGQKKRKDTGEMENVINDWKAKGEVSQVMAAGAAGQLSQAKSAAGAPAKPAAAPWPMKKAQ